MPSPALTPPAHPPPYQACGPILRFAVLTGRTGAFECRTHARPVEAPRRRSTPGMYLNRSAAEVMGIPVVSSALADALGWL